MTGAEVTTLLTSIYATPPAIMRRGGGERLLTRAMSVNGASTSPSAAATIRFRIDKSP